MELKTTLKESIGGVWTVIKWGAWAAVVASVFVNILWSKDGGYFLLGMGAGTLLIATGREMYINGVHRLRTIAGLRDRLSHFGDIEYVLRDIQKDYTWFGLPPNEQVEQGLKNAQLQKEEFQQRIMDLFSDLVKPDDHGKAPN